MSIAILGVLLVVCFCLSDSWKIQTKLKTSFTSFASHETGSERESFAFLDQKQAPRGKVLLIFFVTVN